MSQPVSTPQGSTARAGRITGIDLARALAVIGMIGAHLPFVSDEGIAQHWIRQLSDGLPSALFAVLAGVSLAIISERGVAAGGAALAHARHKIMVRGVILVAIGVVLAALPTPVYIVLQAIGGMYLLLSAAPRWSTRTLVALAGGLFVASGLLDAVGRAVLSSDVILGNYPIVTWLFYGVVGILLHRLVIPRPGVQIALASVCVPVSIAGIWWRENTVVSPDATSAASVSAGSLGSAEPLSGSVVEADPGQVQWLNLESHTGGFGDVTLCTVVALAVLATCLVLCRSQVVNSLTYPLRAMGSMAFTVYVSHVLFASAYFLVAMLDTQSAQLMTAEQTALAAHTPGVEASMSDAFAAASAQTWPGQLNVLVAIVFASLWLRFFRRGPLEWGMVKAIAAATAQDVPPRR